jgi:arylsulfatase A-like enzyme
MAPPPRNVLFIPVDDLRPELGCYGRELVISPHLDRLAAEGVLFERAYCQQAVCAPSRASVLSGCRPETTQVFDLQTPLRQAMPEVLSLPQHFRQSGYETVSIGKVYHHRDDDTEGWSRAPIITKGDWQGRGYLTDEALELARQNDARLRARGDRRSNIGPPFEAADVPDSAYHDGRDADKAIEVLGELARGFREAGRPFFLATGFHKPHLPFNAPRRYWDLYDRDRIPLADNPFAPDGATPFTLGDFGELRGYFGIPAEGPVPDDLARQLIHGYLACVSYVDAQIGRVLHALRELGLEDDTVVMLWGDHGWKLGEHGSWCKHTNFEIDARAPLIVRAPHAQSPGRRCHALVVFVDMYPSLCELCGLAVPDHVEGDSFAPLLRQPDRPWKPAAFHLYPRGGQIMGYAMKTDRHRYIEWRHRADDTVRARELYDHRADPAENVNLAGHADQAAVVEPLAAQMAAGWRAARPARPTPGGPGPG